VKKKTNPNKLALRYCTLTSQAMAATLSQRPYQTVTNYQKSNKLKVKSGTATEIQATEQFSYPWTKINIR